MKYELVFATSLWTRLTGLLLRARCPNKEVLLLAPCKGIHSFGMRISLDVAFLSENGEVLASERNLSPGQIRSNSKAVAVLERRSSPHDSWPEIGSRINLHSETK